GIESLSRGASRADFVEPDRSARRALETNLERLGLRDRAAVWPLELPRGFDRLAAVLRDADLVLLDPPYGGGRTPPAGAAGAPGPAREALKSLGAPGALKPGARVVVEHHRKDQLPERIGALLRLRERHYGETAVTSYEVAPEDAPDAAERMRP